MTERRMTPPEGYNFGASVGPLLARDHDPSGSFSDGNLWLASRTPEGPATLHLARVAGDLVATTYGPGREWLVERADAFAGLRDDLTGFVDLVAPNPLLHRLARTFAGIRMPATGLFFRRALQSVLEQKVTGKEAHRAYRKIVRHFGEPAPGPVELLLPPDPAAVAATPYWVFHPFGVEQRRTQTLQRVALAAAKLEQSPDTAELTRRMTTISGVGPWTAAEVVRVVFGDPDAVSVGDFHTPHVVTWVLAGEVRGTDERMLELLEPFRGHRGRVCELLAFGGMSQRKRFGPRMPIRSFARF